MSKVCTICKVNPSSKYYDKNGKAKYSNARCVECNSLYLKEHYRKNKEKYTDRMRKNREKAKNFVNNLKSEGCSKCPEKDPVCLDYHHLYNKDTTISKLVGSGLKPETIKKEIDKCILLCANCHRKLHFKKYDLSI